MREIRFVHFIPLGRRIEIERKRIILTGSISNFEGDYYHFSPIDSFSFSFSRASTRQTGLMNEYQGRRERRLSHRRSPGNGKFMQKYRA